MPPYKYSRLDPVTEEIRLISLLPGNFDDPICMTIANTPFIIPDVHPLQRMSKEELQTTVPPTNWTVWETLEGRIIFIYEPEDEGGSEYTTWTHPNPDFDRNRYDPTEDVDLTTVQPKYEALSYTWGPIGNPETVYVETSPPSTQTGTASPITLQVGQNLAVALRYLRVVDQPRTLWVDAVCINQNDTEERNEQVTRMEDIYKFAHRVVVWLGPSSNNSKLAISTLGYLGNQVEYTRDHYHGPSPHCTKSGWYANSTKLPYEGETWQALHDLLGRPWFERLWVLQEIQLANRHAIIQCGDDEVLWYSFRRAILCIDTGLKALSVEMRERFDDVSSIAQSKLDSCLPSLLRVAMARNSTEPRDKVYAMLGLMPPAIARSIRPQYALSLGEVYKNTFLSYINLARRLDLLGRASIKEQLVGLPSWVPNWSSTNKTGLVLDFGTRASGVSSAQASYLPPSTLEVTGVHHSTVQSIGEPALGSVHDTFQAVRKIGRERLETEAYPTGESLLEAYA
ncbi:hypothetical protein MMC30_004196 [Trapelia coarctata]|nr:hypothetical protein [Trapelia coarctata]